MSLEKREKTSFEGDKLLYMSLHNYYTKLNNRRRTPNKMLCDNKEDCQSGRQKIKVGDPHNVQLFKVYISKKLFFM